ncbi:hypothetical protein L9F63_000908, partial [Diploptera punctata]
IIGIPSSQIKEKVYYLPEGSFLAQYTLFKQVRTTLTFIQTFNSAARTCDPWPPTFKCLPVFCLNFTRKKGSQENILNNLDRLSSKTRHPNNQSPRYSFSSRTNVLLREFSKLQDIEYSKLDFEFQKPYFATVPKAKYRWDVLSTTMIRRDQSDRLQRKFITLSTNHYSGINVTAEFRRGEWRLNQNLSCPFQRICDILFLQNQNTSLNDISNFL